MIKKLLKRWYCFPLAILALTCIVYVSCLIYIQPLECRGEEYNDKYDLNIGRFHLEFSNLDLRYGDSLLFLKAKNRLDDKWEAFEDDYQWNWGGKPCLVFGNLDFDAQKEIMVFGCHLRQSSVKELKANPGQYDDPYIGLTVGYYDLDRETFHFRKIQDSPLYWAMYVKYCLPGFGKALIAIAIVFLSLILYGIHWMVKGGILLSRKIMSDPSKK